MKTKAELQQATDDDLIWRRRELFNIRTAIEDANGNAQRQSALLRAGVALLYAHWEGFVKRCGTYYLEYVASQGRKGRELTANFIAIRFKTRLAEAAKSKKVSSTNELVEYFTSKLDERLRLPHKGIVDTQSNLSSTVLREIVWTLGLDVSPFETKSQLIDNRLVDRRNHIAHGEPLDIGVAEYIQLHDEVIALMDEFRNQVQNAVATDQYLRT